MDKKIGCFDCVFFYVTLPPRLEPSRDTPIFPGKTQLSCDSQNQSKHTMESELFRALETELSSFNVRDVDMYSNDEIVRKYKNMITTEPELQIVRRTKELKDEELDLFSKQLVSDWQDEPQKKNAADEQT